MSFKIVMIRKAIWPKSQILQGKINDIEGNFKIKFHISSNIIRSCKF